MARLLVVHHTTSPRLQAMFEAVMSGATDQAIEGVTVVARPALVATAIDVLEADGYLLGTPANIGYMSGALKHFFDQIYYPCLDATGRRPYGLYVHGNSDTTGAIRAVEAIAQGLGWRCSATRPGRTSTAAGSWAPRWRRASPCPRPDLPATRTRPAGLAKYLSHAQISYDSPPVRGRVPARGGCGVGWHWYFSVLALGGGTCLAVYAYFVWRHRRATAAASLVVALAAAGWWGLAYAIELAADQLPTKQLWGDAKWLGICLLPPAWFAFVMQYTGHERWVKRWTIAALAVPPAAVIALLATPATHDLVRYYPPSAALRPADAIAQVGPLFWPFLVYADLVIWGCIALFVWTLTRVSRLYWRQSLLLIVTVLLPFLANVLHNLDVGPFGRVELTPFLFVLTGAVLVWGILRFRMLDLAPIARGRIFRVMRDAVVVLDPYGRVVDANLAAERLIGQPVGQAVGQPLERLMPAWAGDGPPNLAVVAGRAYELSVSAIPDRQGRPTGALLIAHDVSERRQAEQDLRESLARERTATERLTVALRQEQAATERLRVLDEMKGAFLQAVSHDLRTPLTSVLGIAMTLNRGHGRLPIGETLDLLGRLEGNARKLDRILTNLLDLERLTRGAVHPDRQRVDVGELVGRIVKDTGPELLGERPVSLEVSKVVADVDAHKVERIVENLLANAARHTPAGTPVWVRVEPRAGGTLIVVEDAGPGVPAEVREAVFQPFQRGPSITAHAPGSGIGLALVAQFAAMHGGRAWVEERPRGGASFRVLLCDDADAAPEMRPL